MTGPHPRVRLNGARGDLPQRSSGEVQNPVAIGDKIRNGNVESIAKFNSPALAWVVATKPSLTPKRLTLERKIDGLAVEYLHVKEENFR